MARNRVPSSPQRRTYQTGGVLPELQTDFRPIPLGLDENGDNDGQIRALAVLIRNRSDRPVYIREGPTADEAKISKGEDYRIWEPNGVNTVSLRGENGGEDVELRVLEAHNDFDITDRIESFVRSISHFVQTATRDTVIEGQNVDLSIDDAGGISVTGEVDASGSSVNVNDGNVVVDDITAANASFDGDITGQSSFDLSVLDRTGERVLRAFEDTGAFGTDGFWTLYQNANFDGQIEYISFNVAVNEQPSSDPIVVIGPSLEIDRGDGKGFQRVSPRALRSTASFRKFSGFSNDGVNVSYQERNAEINVWYEPTNPIGFSRGDDVRIRVGDDPIWAYDSSKEGNDYAVSIEVGVREKVRET